MKSIQWKLVIMFVLVVLSVTLVVGNFLLDKVTDFYHQSFISEVERVLTQDGFQESGITLEQLNERLSAYSTIRLGIDSFRNYYILNDLGEKLESSNKEISDPEPTANILSAMAGKVGKEYNLGADYVDYALPIYSEDSEEHVQYIIYIKDTKDDLIEMTSSINSIILYAIFIGLAVSILLGFLLANTITQPITELTQKADKMAAGDFEHVIEVKSNDEIGTLTNAFNLMAKELDRNIEAIASEKNKMDAIFSHMTDGVMAFNLKGEIIHINYAAQRMLEIDQVEAVKFNNFFEKMNVQISMEDITSPECKSTIKKIIEINGLHIKAFFVTFKLERDKIGGVIVVLQDVTEQQKLDIARREFVANVSHELKTPLASIKSYAETLLDGAIDDKETAESFLNVINNESDRMTRLVRDLLALSSLDHQQTKWKKTNFSFEELIKEVKGKMSLSAKNRGHILTLEITSQLSEIFGDRDKIEQVITNIISNAIKYTPEGGKISITAGCIENGNYVKIIDNGIGIPKEDLPRIFERFYRVDKARSRELGGTGLGLAIAQEIIKAHDGTIDIHSEQGQGTEVTIMLPTS